jgi:uncharacterized metal-binding protein YceD (DUF177 family)
LAKDLYFCNPKFKEMPGLYVIPLSGLKEGRHTFNFEIGETFFAQFEGSEITKGDLAANIELDRHASHLDLRIRITGSVRISCDRCLGIFSHPVESENRLLVKLGSKWDDDDPDLLSIPADEHELDIKQYLYEFIYLSLPLQRVHPEDENGESTCDPEMIKKINEHIVNKETDPRWDQLKKLRNNN